MITDPEEKTAKLDELKSNRIVHESLSEDAVKRLRMVYTWFSQLARSPVTANNSR
jgi:hypothetical protein